MRSPGSDPIRAAFLRSVTLLYQHDKSKRDHDDDRHPDDIK
jgi:hypothetical protein